MKFYSIRIVFTKEEFLYGFTIWHNGEIFDSDRSIYVSRSFPDLTSALAKLATLQRIGREPVKFEENPYDRNIHTIEYSIHW